MTGIQLIFANYNCSQAITHCLRQLLSNESAIPPEVVLDILVVNNSDPAVDIAELPTSSGVTARSVAPGRNVGYFGSVREAMLHPPPPQLAYRILCNPDLEFTAPDFLKRLADLRRPRHCGVIAPSIISTRSRSDQNPYMRQTPSKALRQRWRWVYAHRLFYQFNDWASAAKQALKSRRPYAAEAAQAEDIYAPHGAMIIFAEEFLQQQATELAQVPFLYAEELFVGEICKRTGWTVRYEPELQVHHHEHATTAALAPVRRFAMQRDALLEYLRFMG